jgi:hypothetical protein
MRPPRRLTHASKPSKVNARVGKIERLVHPDGRISWDYTTKMPLLDTRGEVIGICGINKDFTAMKCMQDALEEERDRLKATIAELESKNALLQADLQLARDIGVLTASGLPEADAWQMWEYEPPKPG